MRALRRGMWMTDEKGRVGIVNRIGPDSREKPELEAGEVEFHLVAEDGTTSLITFRAAEGLMQARLREIPEPRRPGKKFAAKLGYAA